MAGGASVVADHLRFPLFWSFLKILAVALEAVLEAKFFMHEDHLWILAVTDIAAVRRGKAGCR